MIYFDNSATTYPKPKEVIRAVSESFTKYGANPGRSGHRFSITTAMKIAEIRNDIAKFVGAESLENVVFTSNCTEALNLAIFGTCQKGGHIICTSNEHNSVLRPIFELKKQGLVEVSVVSPSCDDKITLFDIEKFVKPNTYLICCNHISNVDGMECDIDAIGKFCFEKCITFLVDGAQSVGHKKYDITRQHIDMLAIAPHKGLYAPTGVGVLVFSSKTKIKPLKFGGTGTESYSIEQPLQSPECYESGTLAVPNIIGLGEGLKFVETNFNKINAKIEDLTTFLNYELSNIDNVIVYTHPDNSCGVLSFNVKNTPSTTLATYLDEKFGIMTRSGIHCAPLKHRQLGTLEQGTVRISISCFNTFDECLKLIKAVKMFIKENV